MAGAAVIFRPEDFEDVTRDNGAELKRIMERARVHENEKVSPTLAERRAMTAIVLDFVRARGRIVYGGYAINALIRAKSSADAIYDFAVETPDIEFYSSDAVVDARDLCNVFHKLRYPYVRGSEAMHAETYKVAVDLVQLCDVSYVPKNLMRAIPYVVIDGIKYAHPHFLLIDSLRIITDPLLSYWRLDKAFPRIYKLQKHYPFQRGDNHAAVLASTRGSWAETAPAVAAVLHAARTLLDASAGESAVAVGLAAFERFCVWAGRPAHADARSGEVGVPFVELVLTQYASSVEKIYDHLRAMFGDDAIEYEEYQRFYDYCGRRGKIFYRGKLAAVLFHHHNRCTPVVHVSPGGPGGPEDAFESSTLRTASLSVTALYLMVSKMLCRAASPPQTACQAMCDALIFELYDMRRAFLAGAGKPLLAGDHPFQEFTAHCVGTSVDAKHAHKEETKYRKSRLGLFGMAYFNYEPASPNPTHDNIAGYKYMNSSGNAVRSVADLLFAPAVGLVNARHDVDSGQDVNPGEVANDEKALNSNPKSPKSPRLRGRARERERRASPGRRRRGRQQSPGRRRSRSPSGGR
jgi:hypothetical protein